MSKSETGCNVSFIEAECPKDGKDKYPQSDLKDTLQSMVALKTHLDICQGSYPVGEYFLGFQEEAQVRKRLSSLGYPSLIGCYRRHPRRDFKEEPYADFRRNVADIVTKICGNDAWLSWNNFNLKFTSPSSAGTSRQVLLYNLQLGNWKEWKELLKSVFEEDASLRNCHFIFYWLPPVDAITPEAIRRYHDQFEATDKIWSHSRFLRDILIALGFAIDIPLAPCCHDRNSERIKHLIADHPSHVQPFIHFSEASAKISDSLKATYSKNISWTPELGEVARLYLHNRSIHVTTAHATADEDWKKTEGAIVQEVITHKSGDHGILGEIDKVLRKYSPKDHKWKQDLAISFLWSHFLKTFSSLSVIYMTNREQIRATFVAVDDNIEGVKVKLIQLKNLFPGSYVGYLKGDSYRRILTGESGLHELKLRDIQWIDGSPQNSLRQYDPLPMKKPEESCYTPTFLLIDLEFEGEQKGFELLHRLRSETSEKVLPLIITLSRLDDPQSIQRSLNSGALFHVTKSHFFDIVPAISQVWEHIRNLKDMQKRKYAEYENWHLLTKLPLRKILELQSTRVWGSELSTTTVATKSPERDSSDHAWVKKLPKADVHCHIGSCMSPETIAHTALLVLAEVLCQRGSDSAFDISRTVDFLLPIAADPYLDEKEAPGSKDNEKTLEYKRSFGLKDDETKGKSLYQIAAHALGLKNRSILPERAVLDPDLRIIGELAASIPLFSGSAYAVQKNQLCLMGTQYEHVMLVFVLLLWIRDHFEVEERSNAIDTMIAELERVLEPAFDTMIAELERDLEPALSNEMASYRSLVKDSLKQFAEYWHGQAEKITMAFSGLAPGRGILQFLQSAWSPQRCLGKGNASLFNYLRGCEYGGSQNLQTRAAIFYTIRSIVKSSVEDNVWYRCLRCAVNGYTRFGLQTAREASDALLQSIDYFVGDKSITDGRKVHLNLILAANRQKNQEDFSHNANLALRYHEEESRKRGSEEDLKQSYFPAKAKRSYFPAKAKIVSFDLFGLERGNRPTKFMEQFEKLQAASFPTTIHAGEEDDIGSIHEAVYKAFTQRIGHGLTLRQDKALMRMVRERHIAVELCPASNYLTNGRYEVPSREHMQRLKDASEDEYREMISEPSFYPLRQYLDNNLDVTINTDNPVVSYSTLTEEYLLAARLIGGLTKWEILRLIKNGFRAAVIPKDEKRKLMNEIDDEIYEILLNEE